MTKIWQKSSGASIDRAIEKYTVGQDYILDIGLLRYDLQASKAHVLMLESIDILTSQESVLLIEGLSMIEHLVSSGEFKINVSHEDGHSAIEEYLIKHLGEVGKKIHTGRSRNDQILVTMRLFTLDTLDQFTSQIMSLISILESKVQEIGGTLMPGYTHTQRAMPTTVGTWLGSYAESLKDGLILLEAAKKINDQNPLGSAAGFGNTGLGLDRDMTSDILGFAKTQTNPIYCAYSRGKFEHIVLQALSQVMMDMGKLANDLVYFSSSEFNFFTLPDSFKTGSSIMPQKKNWDIMELVRGNVNIFLGYEFQIREIYKMLFSGYNRDFQLTKEPYLKAINLAQDTFDVCLLVMQNIGVNTVALESACSDDLYATQEAYELVKKGMNFRDAYKKVGEKYL